MLDVVTHPLLYSATFESSETPGLSNKIGWAEVLVEGGKALQAGVGAEPVFHRMVLSEGAVETRFWLVSGEGQVQLGGYRAALAADGTVTLARDQVAVSSINVTLAPDAWALLRLQITGSRVQISVNNVLVIDYTDAAFLPAGQAGFAANTGAVLRVDDFAIYGIVTEPAPLIAESFDALPLPMIALQAPANLVPVSGPGSITLTWTDTNNGVADYEVGRTTHLLWSFPQGSSFLRIVREGTTFTESNLGCGVTLFYLVRAYNGESSTSEWTRTMARTAPCEPIYCPPPLASHRANIGMQGRLSHQGWKPRSRGPKHQQRRAAM